MKVQRIAWILVLLATSVQGWGWASSQSEDGPKIIGSWTVLISSPKNEFPPLKGTYSFVRDGVLIATDVGQLSNPTSTAGQGAWISEGKRVALRWNNFSIDAQGNLDGSAILTGKLKLSPDGKSFAGPAHFEAFDNDGNLVFSADEKLEGSRIYAPKLR